ncbi:MAG: carboxypeptidase regulatory-like domain-containing protein [bacterium]|nr:carboxypeptidase regulatory-like domain-containing protein [bacterium]
MMKLPIVFLLMACILGLLFYSNQSNNPVGAVNAEPSDADVAKVESDLTGLQQESTPTREVIPDLLAVTPKEEVPPVAQCIVFGRAVDERGRGLPGANVRLSGYKGWAEGLELPRLSGRLDLRGWEHKSDEDGRFRFEVPVPDIAITSLRINPDRFHDSVWLRFSDRGGRGTLPALSAGSRELGDIQLSPTGAVKGRVTDAQGNGLADIEVGIGSTAHTTFSRDVLTAEDGTYVVAHAPPGTYGAEAEAEGFLSLFQSPITVELGRDTIGIDFVLQVAPTIEGRVVDENGQALQGVKVGGWPGGGDGGRYADAKSDAQGHFKINLPQQQELCIAATLEGYAPWGNEHRGKFQYAPGTRDLVITMQSVKRTRFIVLDDASGEGIDQFGLGIYLDEGSKASRGGRTERRRPRVKDHAEGFALATAREGVDLYLVAAAGYPLVYGDVKWDTPGEAIQTIRLKRGASVIGRIVRDGQALTDTVVRIVAISPSFGKITPEMLAAMQAGGPMPEAKSYREDNNRLVATQSDDQGRFELKGLKGGMYKLSVLPKDGTPLIIQPTTVKREGTTDMGELNVLAGSFVRGSVLLPPGINPLGIKVYLDDWRQEVSTPLDASGQFAFDDISSGSHTFTLGEVPGRLSSGASTTVDLRPGETSTVQIDATLYAECDVTLTIKLNGRAREGVQVTVTSALDPTRTKYLGTSDSSGAVTARLQAWGESVVDVRFLDVSIQYAGPPVIINPGPPIERELNFDLCSIHLQLPEGVVTPQDGTVQVTLTRQGEQEGESVLHRVLIDGEIMFSPHGSQVLDHTIAMQGLAPGDFTLKLDLCESEPADPTSSSGRMTIRTRDGQTLSPKSPYYSGSLEVQLTAGEESRVVLE